MLTPREKQIVSLVTKGYSNETICKELNIKIQTVKFFLTSIFKKENVTSRWELMAKFNPVALEEIEVVPEWNINGKTLIRRELLNKYAGKKIKIRVITCEECEISQEELDKDL